MLWACASFTDADARATADEHSSTAHACAVHPDSGLSFIRYARADRRGHALSPSITDSARTGGS